MPKKLSVNRKKSACCDDCASSSSFRVDANFEVNQARRAVHDGVDTLIVPVVMAKASVVMNELMIPLDEMQAHTWNGVPVTIGHPSDDTGFISANSSPQTLTSWAVGRIFGATVDGDKLKAEAWIEVARLNKLAPGLLDALEKGNAIDVSTGLFSDVEERTGVLNGRRYKGIHRNVVPDHLAILIDEDGACSFEDGCGVRANLAERTIKVFIAKLNKMVDDMKLFTNSDEDAKAKKAKEEHAAKVAAAKKEMEDYIKANKRGKDDDPRQIAADLISNDASPFVPDDSYSLMEMSSETLKEMRAKFLPNEDDEDEDPPATNTKKGKGMTAKDGKAKANAVDALSKEDREALEFARKSYSEHKAKLVERVVANTAIKKEDAEAMDVKTLEVVANGIKAAPNYAGRAIATNADEPSETAKAMVPVGLVASVSAAKAKKAA